MNVTTLTLFLCISNFFFTIQNFKELKNQRPIFSSNLDSLKELKYLNRKISNDVVEIVQVQKLLTEKVNAFSDKISNTPNHCVNKTPNKSEEDFEIINKKIISQLFQKHK
jgi:hypothetical protein